ncbi:MAG TPA: ChbG/HpnK family deacetylase [Terriglobia bacterium]
MGSKQLIVTADDFGLTEGVNQAIVRAHREGIVTSASLMINGGAAESAVELARQNPTLDIGLHLNLTNDPFSLAANHRGRDLEREIRSQIEAALGTGLNISHLDGHKHVHIIPAVLKLVVRLTGKYGIRALRTMNARTPRLTSLLRRNPASRKAILKQYAFAQGARFLWRLSSPKPIVGPDHFYGITETGFLDRAVFETIIQDLSSGVHEVMAHPGYMDAGLRKLPTRLLEQRQREFELLTSPGIRRLIQEAGVQLISYRDLVETYGNHRTDSLLHRYSAV